MKEKYLRELRSGHSDFVYGWLVRAGRALLGSGYSRIDYDPGQVERLRQVLARHPAVVLSSHKSYLDGGAITVGFHDHGLPPLTVFGGINLSVWPIGAIWRRADMVFVRRGEKDPEYHEALHEYLGNLVAQRRHVQWFIEGTRSRTGKLGPPKLGLLGNMVDGYREGRAEDLALIPLSIAYDQLREVDEYAGEARGARKQAEGLGWLFRFVRSQRGRFGTIYVRFGEPVSVREAVGPPGQPDPGKDPWRLELQKLAFEVSWRINHATPITGASLVTLALLGARGRALTLTQIRVALRGYLRYAERRALPTVPTARLVDDASVQRVLEGLASQGVVESFVDGPQSVYRIAPDGHLAAAYYRNTIVHFFLDGAIAELALLKAADAAPERRIDAFWEEAFELRDLLKFEFFFREKQEFRRALAAELSRLAPDWETQLSRGPDGARTLLEHVPILSSDMILRSFVEAYAVAADVLAAHSPGTVFDEGRFLASCMSVGRQYLLQRRIRNPEAVSRHLFKTGVQLLRHRELCEAGIGREDARREFAAQLWDVVRRMGVVYRVAVRRVEGAITAESPEPAGSAVRREPGHEVV
jgi:glycerol-3-phosphate O-acyltransferase